MKQRNRSRGPGRVIAAAFLAFATLVPLAGPASAYRPARFWQYPHRIESHRTWQAHDRLRARHKEWHAAHLTTAEDGTATPTYTVGEHHPFHHALKHTHKHRHHFRRAVAAQTGKASWYDFGGATGACGVRLTGMYAAHRTWPCGTPVSVRHGDRYVIVTVKDRGPFVSGWILDLSPAAFRKLAPTGAGVISVRAYRLGRRR